MTIKIERKEKPKRLSKKPKKKKLLDRIGFTNALALLIMLFLATGLAGGFYLAMKSIVTGYTGALMCWTVVFTPIGTALSYQRLLIRARLKIVGRMERVLNTRRQWRLTSKKQMKRMPAIVRPSKGG